MLVGMARTSRITARGRLHEEEQIFAAWNRRTFCWDILFGIPDGDPATYSRPQRLAHHAPTPSVAQTIVNSRAARLAEQAILARRETIEQEASMRALARR